MVKFFRAVPMGVLAFPPSQLQLQGILCRDKSLRYLCSTLLGVVTGLNLQGLAHVSNRSSPSYQCYHTF